MSGSWLVFGASGQVGDRVLAHCEAAEQAVIALSRQPRERRSRPAQRWIGARLPDAVPPLPPASAVLSLGPLDLFAEWLAQWHAQDSVPRIVALSSMSVVSKAASAHSGERALAARMHRAEQSLAARCDTLGLPWTILRPTMLWGGGRDRTLSRMARFARRWHCLPLPRASGLRQPMHVDDLAAAAIAAVHQDAARGRCIECGGGEQLAVAEMFRRVRASLPQPGLPIPVPSALVRASAMFARSSRGAAALARLNTDLVADNSVLESLLGVHPRGFAPQPSDWQPERE